MFNDRFEEQENLESHDNPFKSPNHSSFTNFIRNERGDIERFSEGFSENLKSLEEGKESFKKKRHQLASPFKMSKKNYKPKLAELTKEDLQRSIMGISLKDISTSN